MAVIGYLGKSADDGIVFEVSADTVRTLNNFQWSGAAKYSTHQRHNTHALTEFVGLDPDKITFDMILSRQLGADPMGETVKIWRFEREGAALTLVLGDKCYGKYRWNIVSHRINTTYHDGNGAPYSVTVSVSLQEYLNEDF